MMKLRKSKPRIYVNDAVVQPPKFQPGDPIVAIGDGSTGRIEFARHDAMCCIVWDHGGRREWVHEDSIQWPAHFQPTRRR